MSSSLPNMTNAYDEEVAHDFSNVGSAETLGVLVPGTQHDNSNLVLSSSVHVGCDMEQYKRRRLFESQHAMQVDKSSPQPPQHRHKQQRPSNHHQQHLTQQYTSYPLYQAAGTYQQQYQQQPHQPNPQFPQYHMRQAHDTQSNIFQCTFPSDNRSNSNKDISAGSHLLRANAIGGGSSTSLASVESGSSSSSTMMMMSSPTRTTMAKPTDGSGPIPAQNRLAISRCASGTSSSAVGGDTRHDVQDDVGTLSNYSSVSSLSSVLSSGATSTSTLTNMGTSPTASGVKLESPPTRDMVVVTPQHTVKGVGADSSGTTIYNKEQLKVFQQQQLQRLKEQPQANEYQQQAYMTVEIPLVHNVLQIIEQPAERGRFRYSKERRNTALNGRREGSFPSVALVPDGPFRNCIREGTMVDVHVVTKDDDALGDPVHHWHVLEGKDGDPVARSIDKNGHASFPHLVVTRGPCNDKSPSKRSSEDQQVIRLMFSIVFRTESGTLVRSRILSDPIHGRDLKLHKVSHSSVPAKGGEVIFLTSKVKRRTVKLKITETPAPQDLGRWKEMMTMNNHVTNGWDLDANLRPTIYIADLQVHYQYALIVHIPAYWDPSITSPRSVEVQLVDDDQCSAALVIQYMPTPNLSTPPRPPQPPPQQISSLSVSGMGGQVTSFISRSVSPLLASSIGKEAFADALAMGYGLDPPVESPPPPSSNSHSYHQQKHGPAASVSIAAIGPVDSAFYGMPTTSSTTAGSVCTPHSQHHRNTVADIDVSMEEHHPHEAHMHAFQPRQHLQTPSQWHQRHQQQQRQQQRQHAQEHRGDQPMMMEEDHKEPTITPTNSPSPSTIRKHRPKNSPSMASTTTPPMSATQPQPSPPQKVFESNFETFL